MFKKTLPFLLWVLSPFYICNSNYALILFQLCKSNTLWNIFMTLSRNIQQDETTCHIRITTLAFLLLELSPLLVFEFDFVSAL